MAEAKVKICGITNVTDALASVKAGCDALGFIFYRKSPRYISPSKARVIVTQLPPRIKKIGVFVNAREKSIKQIARICNLDMLQFHGNETPEFCRRFSGYRVIKAFRIKDRGDLSMLQRYRLNAYLFDTFEKNKFGGTGRQFDWRLLKTISTSGVLVFLSGGINAHNVRRALKTVRPDWVDVSSAVESRPGKKDHTKLRRFIRAVKDKRGR